MSSSVLLMSMSADGYIAGPDDRPGNPGGDDFMRLHEWYLDDAGEVGRPDGEAGEIWDELNATGAVLVGRRTAEQVDYYGGHHHGVPIFVVSHDPTPVGYENVHVVGDIETAMAQAKAAAGRGVSIVPLSVATFYQRPDVVTVPVDNLAPNTVALAWIATRRSRLLQDFAGLAPTVTWTP